MFGREFKAAEHRRHIPPTQRVGYGVEPVSSRTADRWLLDDLAEMAGLSTRLSNGWEILQTNGGGPVLFREFNDYDSGKVSPPDSPGGPWNWSVHARLYQVNVGSGAGNTAEEAMSMVEQTYAEYKRTASRKTAADGDEVDLTYEQAREILSDPSHDAYGKVRLYGIIGEGETAGQIIGIKSLQNLDRFAYDRIYTIERSGVPIFRANRKRATFAPGDRVKNEHDNVSGTVVVTDPYSGEVTVDWEDGETTTERRDNLVQAARRRTANRRTAFLDTVELTEPRHRVAGWDWDDHLNGFIAAEASREFTCACGDNVPAPGYTDCRCGKRWNTYTISANGSKKMIAREVPVRENVVMARTASSRKQAADWSGIIEDYLAWCGGDWNPESPIIRDEYVDTTTAGNDSEYVEQVRNVLTNHFKMKPIRKWAAIYHITQVQQDPSIVKPGDLIATDSSRGRVHKILPPDGMGIMVIMMEDGGRLTLRTSARKQAAPSSGADAIAQHFPGWRVDDENGNFWEIQSPGGEHAFIHEEDGTYTVLTNDNTPDEFYETGLSFEDALAEVRAEGVI